MHEDKIDHLLTAISERLAQYNAARQVQQTQAAVGPVGQAGLVGQVQGGLPAQQVGLVPTGQTPQVQVGLPVQQMGLMQIGTTPQVTGVSVPVAIPLPDGRELAIRIHFAPEAAQNLQQLAIWCAQAYGQYLAARWPSRFRSNGYAYDRYDRKRRY